MIQQKISYQAPEIEVIKIEVEKGFATSNNPNENYNSNQWN